MRIAVPILAALLLLPGCGDSAPSAPPTVRLAAVPGRPAAGYFTLRIEGDRGALVEVTSAQVGRVEMHETMSHGNMSTMRAIARIPVAEGDMLRFAPGGRHLMLFDVDPAVPPGGRILLLLHFERGPPVPLEAMVTSASGEAR